MSTQLDYLTPKEGGFKWWENPESLKDTEKNNSWEPPKSVDLLYNVHINRDTHIKSPFYHRRYPYEFKTKEYFLYKKEKLDKPKEQPKVTVNPEKKDKQIVKVELKSSTKTDTTFRDIFKQKSLRQRIYDGEVFFYEDYVEYNIARDYCRLFGRPFNIPRRDWGGKNYHFGEKILDEQINEDKVEILKKETVKKPDKFQDESNKKQSETDALIMSTKFLDDFKKNELLKGEIPNLFENSTPIVNQKGRRDRWVSFHNLKNYGRMIDSVTKCPPIHLQLQSALQTGWNLPLNKSSFQKQETDTLNKTSDLYNVSQEHMEEVNKILLERKKREEESQLDFTKMLKSKNNSANQSVYTVGGGRYQI